MKLRTPAALDAVNRPGAAILLEVRRRLAIEPGEHPPDHAAIERARGYWKVFGHAGAVAFVRTGYPETTTTVLRRFGSVPEDLRI